MPKHFLSFHTVFILNENIKWMEEFIIYYRNLGFDHFYLYDNEGSTGYSSTKTSNKYGFPIKNIPDEQNKKDLDYILNKYGNFITYTKWQPKDSGGNIIYRQDDSIIDCITHQGKYNEWIAFLDFDEFIFSVKNINLVEYLKSLDESVSCVKITQKKFLDRFLTKQKLITQEFQCINNLDIGVEWGPKNIIRCKDYISINYIHSINVKNKTIVPDKDILRFNHYNLNKKQIKWMKEEYYKNNDAFYFNLDGEGSGNGSGNGNSIDNGMIRYKEIFNCF